jgi:hypothetical protein
LSLLHARIETKPRENPVSNFALGLVVVGLPASERGSPNSQNLTELPLVESQFFSLLVDVLSDGLRVGW